MKRKIAKQTTVECSHCGHLNVFDQPYRYHAGFGNQGFLYNETGNRTLIWSSFDREFEAIVGRVHPWALNVDQQKKVEDRLLPDTGGRWLFANPARCAKCKEPISEPMVKDIYYVVYEGSLDLDPVDHKGRGLKDIMKK
jgi:DNA-directed RNA polymerase subunit RPC12/RpoP